MRLHYRGALETIGSVVAQGVDALGKVRGIRGYHAPLAGSDHFARMKRETAEFGKAPDGLALIGGTDRTRSVFDDRKIVPLGHLQNRLHFSREAEKMNRDNRAGARRHRGGQGFRIEVICGRIDVAEDGTSTGVLGTVRAGDPGERGHQHFITAAYPQGQDGHVQCGGTRGRGQGMIDLMALGECFLERGRGRALRDPAGIENFLHRLDFIVIETWTGDGQGNLGKVGRFGGHVLFLESRPGPP